MIEMPETGEQTIKRVPGSYALGRKLRELRLRKKIGLLDLAKHTGLSPSMLSRLETGKLTPKERNLTATGRPAKCLPVRW